MNTVEVPNLSTETIDYEPVDESYNTDMNSVNSYSDYSSASGFNNSQISNVICFVLIFYTLIRNI